MIQSYKNIVHYTGTLKNKEFTSCEFYNVAKEILFYSSIYSYSAANFIKELDANKDEDIVVRGNCPGGSVWDTYGMIAKFSEHPKGKKIKVDGIAASAFAYMILEADKDNVECLDITTFLYHRGTMSWDPAEDKNLPESDLRALNMVNGRLRASMEKRADSALFKMVTGKTYDDVFSLDNRIDIVLNAEQAKQLGFVGKINKLTPDMRSEIMALASAHNVAAFSTGIQSKTETIKTVNMTAAEFKQQHPAAYAEVLAEGHKQGVTAEQERVGAWQAWQETDPKAVAEGIASGAMVTTKTISEMSAKAAAKRNLQAAKEDGAPEVQTPEKETAGADTKMAWKDTVKANLKKMK